jgi:hypothetical protein
MNKTGVVASLVTLFVVGCGGGSGARPEDSGAPDGDSTNDGGADHAADVVQRAFPADEISGTRTRARYWLVEDGQRVPQVSGLDAPVWFDTKLGTPCVWRPLEGPSTAESWVCAPYAAYGVLEKFFTDAECKVPAQAARSYFYEWVTKEAGPPSAPSSNTPSFSQPWGSNELDRQVSCADKTFARDADGWVELGTPLAATTLYDGSAGCKAITLAPGEVLRSIVHKLERSELATAHVGRVDTGHRLSTHQLVSDDGARQRIGWYDNVLGVACTVGVAADGKRRCLPEGDDMGNGGFGFFVDAAGGPLALAGDPNPYQPGSYRRLVGPALACGQTRTSVYRIGTTYEGDVYVPGNPTPLTADIKPAGTWLHVTEVPAESMDLFEPKTLGGRLQHSALVDAEGALDVFPFGATPFGGTIARFTEGLIDSTLEQPCRFQHLADGSNRCVPAWSEQEQGLNCTRNIVVNVHPYTQCLGDPAATFTAVWKGDACAGGYQVSALGKLITPSGAVGQCSVLDRDGFSYYEIGAVPPPGTFAGATVMTE